MARDDALTVAPRSPLFKRYTFFAMSHWMDSMHRLLPVTTALAAVIALSACSNDAHPSALAARAAVRHYGSIDFEPCALSGVMAAQSVDALCGHLKVPENPAAPHGRMIDLHIAWLRAGDKGEPATDPVFFIAGGPGQAATEFTGAVASALREVLKQRNVFLVDQRGTGKSAPLDCPASLKDKYKDREDTASIGDYARDCAAAIKADPRMYTTTIAIEDLDRVRAALDAPKVNLVGVSYGTRVAQQYAMRHPDQVRTLVLDGVLPNDVVAGGEFPRTFERTLELRAKACAADIVCRAHYPQDLRTQLTLLKTRLANAPVDVDFRDPQTGKARREKLTADTVGSISQLFSYVPEAAALLPVVVDEAVHERYAPLMALASMGQSSMVGGMNRGMQWSVICAEDADRYVARGEDAGTVLGTAPVDAFFAACGSWPHGTRPANFTSSLAGAVPVLLMSGELDPVTPPEYAARVAAALPNARALVLRGQGHGVMAVGCMPKLIGQFVESTNAKKLDAKCLDSVAATPPFTSFNGWEP